MATDQSPDGKSPGNGPALPIDWKMHLYDLICAEAGMFGNHVVSAGSVAAEMFLKWEEIREYLNGFPVEQRRGRLINMIRCKKIDMYRKRTRHTSLAGTSDLNQLVADAKIESPGSGLER